MLYINTFIHYNRKEVIMKKSIVLMTVFAVSVALLCVGFGCDGNDRSADWEGNVDGFLGRINETPGSGGGGVAVHKVTVSSVGSGATGSGNYFVGQTVFINAGTHGTIWMHFDRWTTLSKGVTFADSAKASTSFTMPANDVTVTAVFDTTEYAVTVDAGVGATGSGKYKFGRTVNIAVGAIPSGYDEFFMWTGISNVATSSTMPAISFTMPPYAVKATAIFGVSGGKTYRTVEIGGKRWMAENLNYKMSSGGSWCYGNDDSNCDKYGRLYNWSAATLVCPTGWHLPTREEWGALAKAAGGTGDYGTAGAAGKKLKATRGWGPLNGTDDFGFSALPGGNSYISGIFYGAGNYGYWWTATGGNRRAYHRGMDGYDDRVNEGDNDVDDGRSVRCVGGD
jgi:uncharacterized protein (TIGR02145 family)